MIRFSSGIMPAIVSGMILLAGCSVKEDRTECPCRLVLDFSGVDSENVKSVLVTILSDDGRGCSMTVGAEAFPYPVEVKVPRLETARITAVSNVDWFEVTASGLMIPYGMDCPETYMSNELICTDCERLEKEIVLGKNYCRLTVCVEDSSHFPFHLVVRGLVDGYLNDGSLSVGDFFCPARDTGDGIFSVALPRQMDGSLMLDVDDGTSVLKSFAIGEMILKCGYDWNASDLGDITLGIDYARTEMTVSVQGWDKVYIFDFVI